MYRESEQSFGEIDYSKILMLTDENGQITYTFRLTKPDEILLEEFYFDNLIVKVTQENQYEVYILRYIPDEYTLNNLSFNDFKGEIEHYPVNKSFIDSDFVEDNLLNKEDCRMITITDCGLSGHHSSLSDPGCDSDQLIVTILVECAGVSETINTGTYTTPGSTSGPGGGSGVGGPGGGSSTPVISPYDEVDLARIDTVNKKLSLNFSEKDWLYNRYDVAMSIYSFLEDNFFSDESIAFAEEAVEALREDGEVDWEDKVIIENSLNDYPCIKNTILTLLETDNSLLKETIGTFIDDANYNLVFMMAMDGDESYDCRDGSDACTFANEIDINSNVYIIIKNPNLNPLDMVGSIIHESIHAEIHRYVVRHNSGVDTNDRNRLLQLYGFYTGNDAITNAQHQYMAENYVTPIAKAVRQIDNNNFDLNHYMGFGWDGLARYGLTSDLLTDSQIDNYENLKREVNVNTNYNPCN